MAKDRERIPQKTRDKVLKEFNHRCAKCGADRPHLHHIDEDPSNNDPMNLIPLCPNCHLTDQHNPTGSIEPDKLRLFRQCKDPTILTPQFHALFTRMRFLNEIPTSYPDVPSMIEQGKSAKFQVEELIMFVGSLEMGDFYSARLTQVLKLDDFRDIAFWTADPEAPFTPALYGITAKKYLMNLRAVRMEVYDLLVELLRFQRWTVSE